MAEPLRADLSGRTCLVTGASAGIGLAAAHGLARLGARVVMAVRNPEKGERARRAVMGATGREVEMAVVDLGSRKSIRAFARDFTARHPKLDVLVNNAGIWSESRKVSPDGVELVWATNVLNYFLVTELAAAAAPGGGEGPRRQRRLAARGRARPRRRPVRAPPVVRPRRLRAEQAGRPHAHLGARPEALRDRDVTANAMHPGFVATEIFGKGGGLVSLGASLYSKLRGRRPEEGADTVVWLAASPEVENRSGLFWIDRQERRCRFRDEAGEEALWALCQDMTNSAAS